MLKKTTWLQKNNASSAEIFQREKRRRTHFSQGLRVLAIDDNIVCLRILAFNLFRCGYQVTMTMNASEAIDMLRKNKNGFDIVITDVMRSDMDGFKLLEIIGSLEMDIPVIMTSANSDIETIEKGVMHGARDYLVKPVRMEILRNIWQHVMRKASSYYPKPAAQLITDDHDVADQYTTGSSRSSEELFQQLAAHDSNKKPRIEWIPELHLKFVAAVQRLEATGDKDKVVPKYILKCMNEPHLTRQQVASHLQKYRLALDKKKKQRETSMLEMNNHLGGAVPTCRHLFSSYGTNFSGLGSINGYINDIYNLLGGNNNNGFKSTPNIYNPVHQHQPISNTGENVLPFQEVHQDQGQHTSPNDVVEIPGPRISTTNQSQPEWSTITNQTSQSRTRSTITNQTSQIRTSSSTTTTINYGYHQQQQMPAPQVHTPPPPAVASSCSTNTPPPPPPAGSFGILSDSISIPCDQPNQLNVDNCVAGNGYSASRRITRFPDLPDSSEVELVISYLSGLSELERNLPTFSDRHEISSVNDWSATCAPDLMVDMPDQIDDTLEENDEQIMDEGFVPDESDETIHGQCENGIYYDSEEEIIAMFLHNPAPTL